MLLAALAVMISLARTESTITRSTLVTVASPGRCSRPVKMSFRFPGQVNAVARSGLSFLFPGQVVRFPCSGQSGHPVRSAVPFSRSGQSGHPVRSAVPFSRSGQSGHSPVARSGQCGHPVGPVALTGWAWSRSGRPVNTILCGLGLGVLGLRVEVPGHSRLCYTEVFAGIENHEW